MFILYIFLFIYACAYIWCATDFLYDFVKGILECIEKIQDSFIKDEVERKKRQFKRYEKYCKKQIFSQFTREQKKYCKQGSSKEEFERRFDEIISENPKIYRNFYREESKRIDTLQKERREFYKKGQLNDSERAKYNKYVQEVVVKKGQMLYDLVAGWENKAEEQAKKKREQYAEYEPLLSKMEKIMPLSQAEEYLDMPSLHIRWQQIMEYIAGHDFGLKTIREECLDVIIELLKSTPGGKEADEGFYFYIKNIFRDLDNYERIRCIIATTAYNFLEELTSMRRGNVKIIESGIIEAFCFMAKKLNVEISPERLMGRVHPRLIKQMIVEEIVVQMRERAIPEDADGLGGAWTVLQDEETVQQIIRKLNLVNQNVKEN